MKKGKILTVILLGFFLFPLAFGSVSSQLPDRPISESSTFNAVVNHSKLNDLNANKVHDRFEAIIKNGYEGDMYEAVVTFNQPLSDVLVEKINAVGGEILNSWSVIHGANVRIRGTQINSLANIPGITLITENYESRALLSTSVPQINVRPYVWDTLGYEGDSSHAIAIIDTGIDASHTDIGASKVVAWQDFSGHDAAVGGDEYATVTDWEGHGTHCSSIAAGTGAASGTASTVDVSGTLGLPQLDELNGYVRHLEVETTGHVTITINWNERPGPDSATDTLFCALDIDGSGTFTGSDKIVSADYSASPLVLTTDSPLSPGQYQFLIGPYQGIPGEVGRASIRYTITRPASSTSDGNNKYRGVAPNCKLVGLKALDDAGVGSQADFTDALDWIHTNGATYDIVVVSMSLGFDSEISAVDTAINNLVAEGYVCVAAAGNGHQDGDYIYSPGTASKVITVGAIDDVDKVAVYSSNGYPGDNKPDVLAPGGAYTYPLGADEDTHLIVAADTNVKDVVEFESGSPDIYWETEMTSNDYQALQGTSMACPHVAGLAALIIEAMGTDWTHTEADARLVKNYLCGTATEVRYGESFGGTSQSPTLNRGNRDSVEGFGKVHGDAAIEAFLTTYSAGSIATDTLSSSPTSKQSWARKVELVENIQFEAGVEMDGSADFDLYLYDPTADMASATGILASSTSSTAGSPENLNYTPANNMTAYIVIKRVSGSGSFTLSAEATATGTPTGSGFVFIGISSALWAILGTIGLASIVLLSKRRRA